MILRIALTLFLATNVSAFFVAPAGVTRRPFVPLQVSLSETSANTEIPLESADDADKPAEVVAESAVESASPVVEGSSTAEPAVPASKSTERHTLYVGNLPFGKQHILGFYSIFSTLIPNMNS
jgi:hypothetical protein